MEYIKFYLPPETARMFREAAMQEYGFKKGALSKAAQSVILEWVNRRKTKEKKWLMCQFPEYREYMENPVESMDGILKDVKESSVGLQHKVGEIWAQNTLAKMRDKH